MAVLAHPVTRRSLTAYLLDVGMALSADGEMFTPAWSLFQNGHMLVRPQQWEIDGGILVSGHRLLPLYHPALLPSEITMSREDGTELPRRTVVVPFARATVYYSLFGAESLHQLIVLEDESNLEADFESSRDAVVRLSVWDVSDLYTRTGFREGDYFDCRLDDWWEGRFTMAYRPAAELSDAHRQRWNGTLGTAFDQMFDHFGEPVDIPKQLRYVWYFATALGGRSFLDYPAGTVGEFLAADNPVRITAPWRTSGSLSSTLWFEESPQQQAPPSATTAPEPEGIVGDLDEILTDIGSVLTEDELEAYMRDAVFNDRDLSSVIMRVFSGADLIFVDEEQQESFFDELDELWSQVVDEYDRSADEAVAPVRARFLALYDRQIRWIRDLDAQGIDPADLPEGPVRQVGEFFGMITGTIELLNRDLGGEEKGLHALNQQLDAIEETAVEILDEATRAVDGVFDDTPVFELKISLKTIRPQIWRRIRVPGSVHLDQLHRIIQIAMGWFGGHLHLFRIDGEVFAPAELDEPEAHPEEHFRLAQIGFREKDRFQYVYDFGDDWVHEILVSRILDPDDLPERDRTTPRILSGKRAAPPEDCGGISGYCYLMEETDQEELEQIAPPGWDPEHFDVDWTNRILAEEFHGW